MSDYEDEDFENYEEDDFEKEEEEGDDDYDVLPSSMSKSGTPAQPATPVESPSPIRAKGGPQRNSYASGQRPPSAGTPTSILANRTTHTVDVPVFAGLTDAQRRAASKKLTAGLKKMKKIKLSVVAMEDFPQLQALSPYELYRMGRSKYAGVKVAKTQTHEDDKDEEVQTDEITTRLYSCQVPDDRNVVFEGEHTAVATGGASAAANAHAHRAAMRITQMAPDQENRLMAFMRWAGPIMLAALGMNPTVKKIAMNAFGSVDPNTSGLSGGSVRLAFDKLLHQRPVTCVSYCQGGSPLLLATYSPVGAQLGAAALLQDHTLNSKGVTCVWDLSAPATPSAVMVSEGSPSVCCWAPAPSTTLVFAGMEEGGVCAWDLEESEGRHPRESVGGQLVVARRPSYTTEYLADVATSAAPVVGIATIPSTENRSRPCQLIALNGWGCVMLFTVTILPPADKGGSTDMDLGLRPGSRLKLVRTTQMTRLGMNTLKPAPHNKMPRLDQVVQAFSLQLLPGQERQFVVGSDSGKVLRGSWVGVPPAPKEYVCDDHRGRLATQPSSPAMPSQVTSLHASPFIPGVFLAGHSSGAVLLHDADVAPAVAVWPDVSKTKILVVRWSPTRPTVFFVLDALCNLYTFDLAKTRSGPVLAQSCMMQEPSKKMASIPSFFDAGVVNTAEPGKGANRPGTPSYCIAYDDGHLLVHLVSNAWATAGQGELAVLQDVVGSAKKPAAAKPAAKKPAAAKAAAPKEGGSPSPEKKKAAPKPAADGSAGSGAASPDKPPEKKKVAKPKPAPPPAE